MKLSKKGSMSISKPLVALIIGLIGAVILFYAAPPLYVVLTNATEASGFADIPLLGPMAPVIGLVFGAIVLIGGLVLMFRVLTSSGK